MKRVSFAEKLIRIYIYEHNIISKPRSYHKIAA